MADLKLRTDDTFPTFSLKKNFQPPPFEEFLEINFQFSFVSILHTLMALWLIHLTVKAEVPGSIFNVGFEYIFAIITH
jgi:hypothetical protein